MLIETWQLWQALEGPVKRREIDVAAKNKIVKPLPDNLAQRAIRVRLDTKGNVKSVESIAEEERAGLWRIGTTRQDKFPIMKLRGPFATVDDATKKQFEEASGNELRDAVIASYESGVWEEQDCTKTDGPWKGSRLRASKVLQYLGRSEDFAALRDLVRRFDRATQRPSRLVGQIADVGIKAIQVGTLDNTVAMVSLISGNDTPVEVAFDLDGQDSSSTIYTPRMYQAVVDFLPTDLGDRVLDHRAERCAFTGQEGHLLREPFPDVSLPEIGSKPIISMASLASDKAKCNARYGLTEYTVVPVSTQAARQMQKALAWIVGEEREEETWLRVPSGKYETRNNKKYEKRDVLIAYVASKPDAKQKLCRIIGRNPEQMTETGFTADASAVCEALQGIVREIPKAKLNLFILTKATDGQAKVALAESPEVEQVLAAVRWWDEAGRNVPDIRLWLPSEGQRHSVHGRPLTPYPAEVVRLLAEQWIRDGAESHKAAGPGLADVFDLYLWRTGEWEQRYRWQPAVRKLLDLTLRRMSPLLIGAFAAAHAEIIDDDGDQSDDEPSGQQVRRYSRRSRQIALFGTSLLGILIDALDHKEKSYMSDTAFKIGQMLALADTLHKDYCMIERRGSMPSSLIGAAMMPRALDSPVNALVMLADRMSPYLRWAKSVQQPAGEGVTEQTRICYFEALKTQRRYEPLCQSVYEQGLPNVQEWGDEQKAQLLLGYLAPPPDDPRPPKQKGTSNE